MIKISYEQWLQLEPIALMLAKKKNPNATTAIGWDPLRDGDCLCYICGEIFKLLEDDEDYNTAREHGYLHLKEHNLLPFI